MFNKFSGPLSIFFPVPQLSPKFQKVFTVLLLKLVFFQQVSVFEKWKALKYLENGMSNKRVTEKYSVPRKKWVKKVKKQQKVMSFVGVEKKVMNFKW